MKKETEYLYVRISPELKKRLRIMLAEEGRTVTEFVTQTIIAELDALDSIKAGIDSQSEES